MTTTERRRNMRAENCRGCRAWVEAGAGYLYQDTNSRRGRSRMNRTGRFGWLVKCEKCHTGETVKEARRAEAAERGKRWSVRDVERFAVEPGRYTYVRFYSNRAGVVRLFLPVCGPGFDETSEPCVLVSAGGELVVAVYCDLINGQFGAGTPFDAGDPIGGRELTAKAAARLNERVRVVEEQVRVTVAQVAG